MNNMMKCYCSHCKTQTNHIIVGEASNHYNDEDEGYFSTDTYRIVKCMGCDTVSFNREMTGSEFIRYNQFNEEEIYSEFESYPIKEDSIEPLECWELPPIVSGIYSESVKALNQGCNVLATIGLRATIEALCIDKNIPGTLKTKIDRLRSQGIITKEDCRRLHELRQSGNDSAHELIALEKDKLLLLLEIINNMLSNQYILDKKFKNTFFYRFESFESFKSLLVEGLRKYSIGSQYVLRAFMPKEYKYRMEDIDRYEEELATMIEDRTFPNLEKVGQPEEGKKQIYKLLSY